jgi:hypothetical protein
MKSFTSVEFSSAAASIPRPREKAISVKGSSSAGRWFA